jgi:hypothetical protein
MLLNDLCYHHNFFPIYILRIILTQYVLTKFYEKRGIFLRNVSVLKFLPIMILNYFLVIITLLLSENLKLLQNSLAFQKTSYTSITIMVILMFPDFTQNKALGWPILIFLLNLRGNQFMLLCVSLA